jgi:hypothetical protein
MIAEDTDFDLASDGGVGIGEDLELGLDFFGEVAILTGVDIGVDFGDGIEANGVFFGLGLSCLFELFGEVITIGFGVSIF